MQIPLEDVHVVFRAIKQHGRQRLFKLLIGQVESKALYSYAIT